MKNVFVALLFLSGLSAFGQHSDTLPHQEHSPRVKLLVYARVIVDAQKEWRTDQNIVGNFKICNWLRLEAGTRLGEKQQAFTSYCHYKIELQSKWFYDVFRVLTRLSDNVTYYPAPTYRKTNAIFIAEAKYPLSKSFHVLAAGGYVFSSHQSNKPDFMPSAAGTQKNYPIFKLSLKYLYKKAEVEATYGSYDVFNPYLYNQPFAQILGAYEVSKRCKLQSYCRYQYNNNVAVPYNYFFSFGAIFSLP
ncbi:MAG: hypothetical protein JST67_00500 [Bacteroidetes bacterium]|nr:hypothetical protein [Bacteroidota bacterium]